MTDGRKRRFRRSVREARERYARRGGWLGTLNLEGRAQRRSPRREQTVIPR